MFCRHIWKLEKEEYNYTIYKIVTNVPINKYNHYIQYFKCVKCGKEKIEASSREDIMDSDEKRGIIK